ncbi:MAG: DUF5615 family PIN-like protein [Nanoarchaeota archaeon]
MSMKFLTDENVAISVVKAIRTAGFDVKDVKEEKLHALSDKEVVNFANKEDRIIITHDKDFGILLSQKKGDMSGVILLRFKNQNPKLIAPIILSVLRSNVHEKFVGNLVIISENSVVIQKVK